MTNQFTYQVDPEEAGVVLGRSGDPSPRGWSVVSEDTWFFRNKQMADKAQTVAGYTDKDFYMDCTKAKIVCDVHREMPGSTPGEHHVEILKRYLEQQNIVIRPRELLVGNWAGDEHGIVFDPRSDLYYPFKEFTESGRAFMWENGKKVPVPKEVQDDVQAFCEEHNIVYALKPLMSDMLYKMYYEGGQRYWEIPGTTGLRANPDHEWYMTKGFRKLINMMEETIKRLEQELLESTGSKYVDLSKRINDCKCSVKATESVITWIKRHGTEAKKLAENETDPKEKERLETIATQCEWISEKPPRDFWEMMQLHELSFQAHCFIEHACHTITFRPDQTWWTWYKKSVLEDKTLSREKAADIVAFYFIKYHEIGLLCDLKTFRLTGLGTRDYSVVTIGGQNGDGTDATNDLSMLILDVIDGYRMHFPDVKVRWHNKFDKTNFRRVIEVMRTGMGSPSVRNDNTAIDGMMRQYGNMTMEEARSWAVVGCNTPGLTIHSRGATRRSARNLNSLKPLEFTLFNGREPDEGFEWVQVPETGDPRDFKDFEEFYQAFLKQWDFFVKTGINQRCLADDFYNQFIRRPFLSILYERCVTEGRDLMSLDAPWLSFNNAAGWVDTMDSLAGIKYWVYEKKKYTMDQLLTALRADWVGYEDMQQDFRDAPKFGNNEDFVDLIFARAVHDCTELGKKMLDLRDEPAGLLQGIVITLMYHYAPLSGANANGRKRGDKLADGGINPHSEFDKSGAWDKLASAMKIDQSEFKAWVYNQKWNFNAVKGEAGLDKLVDYTLAGLEGGMDQLQYNLVSNEVLVDAKKHPENYPNLGVRISGFSVNFVSLPEFVQDTVIDRVSHEL